MKIRNYLAKFNFKDLTPQIQQTVGVVRETIPFIKKHRLWKGYFDYKWIAVLSIIISVSFTWISYQNLRNNYADEFITNTEAQIQENLKETVGDIKFESARGARTSGSKYILVILLEMIIFYFSVKTLAILTENPRRPTFKEFIQC